MLDLNFVRDNFEKVRAQLAQRNANIELFDDFARLDTTRRRIIGESDALNAARNLASKSIGELMKTGKRDEAESARAEVATTKERIATLDRQRDTAETAMRELLVALPNIPDDSVPHGADESANTEVRRWGVAPAFDFQARDHVELGERLKILDFERAAKLTGARFSILNGAGAKLERALGNLMLDVHTQAHGYTETSPPVIVNRESLFGTGQLPKFAEDLFKLEDEREFYLIPTAEVPITNYHRNETLNGEDLPLKWTARTTCFRSEAGSYGRDTRGLIRQHQFEKVELVKYCLPEQSFDELESLTRDAERILQLLGLPYRVMLLCTGDMGFSAAKTYDLEVWLPGQNAFREISSCSNCTDFQARRANIRFKRTPKDKPEYVHTLNGSGLAIGRTLIAILENYQQADGSILIPEALQHYMNGLQKVEV